MNFLHPGLFALGAAAVALPIIIHLLMRRRRQPQPWGAMRFLLEAYKRTRRRLIVERWLLLACRCLLVAALAVAIGRPLLGGGSAADGSAVRRTVYLVLDDSITAAARDGTRGPAFGRHIERAQSLLAALRDGDRAGLVLMGSPSPAVVLPPTSDLAGLRRTLAELRPSAARADLPAALAAAGASIAEQRVAERRAEGDEVIVVLSELRAGSASPDQPLPKLPPGVRLAADRPATGTLGNTGVLRITPARGVIASDQAGIGQVVTVGLQRSGEVSGPASASLTLKLGEPGGASLSEATATARFAAGERTASATVALPPFAAPRTAASLVLEARTAGGDAIGADDLWRLPVEVRSALRVGIVADVPGAVLLARTGLGDRGIEGASQARWITLALRPTETPAIELTELDPAGLDASALSGIDAVFVAGPHRLSDEGWTRLVAFARTGGLLVALPTPDAQSHTWTEGLGRALARNAGDQARGSEEQAGGTGTLGLGLQALDLTASPAGLSGTVSTPGGEGELAGADLLAQLRPDMAELARPVAVQRLLPVTGPATVPMLPLLTTTDGRPLLMVTGGGTSTGSGGGLSRGRVAVFTTSLHLTWTDLPAKPLMVPLLQEVLRQGLSSARPALWTTAGALLALPTTASELRRLDATGADGESRDGVPSTLAVRPAAGGAPNVNVRNASLWTVADATGGVRGLAAINPDAAAARTDVSDAAAVESWLRAATPSTGPAGSAGATATADALVWLDGPGDGGTPSSGDADAAGEAGRATLGRIFSGGRADGGTPTTAMLFALAGVLALAELLLARRAGPSAGGMGPMLTGTLKGGTGDA